MEDNVLQLTVLLIVILCSILFYRYCMCEYHQESFQNKPYVHKRDSEMYDDFYINEYDILYETEKYSENDFNNISSTVVLAPDSTILDIGCGTGSLLKRFEKNGNYHNVGVDRSEAAINKARENIQIGDVLCKDVLVDPMLFEKESFDLICCTHFAIYEIEDQSQLFKYAYHWAKIGGFLAIHMVDVQNFNMITPNSDLFPHLKPFTTLKDRITKSIIEKQEYVFSSYYDNVDTDKIERIETFKCNNKCRKNEITLYMNSKESIIAKAIQNGFKYHSEVSYNLIPDEYQNLVFFVKV